MKLAPSVKKTTEFSERHKTELLVEVFNILMKNIPELKNNNKSVIVKSRRFSFMVWLNSYETLMEYSKNS